MTTLREIAERAGVSIATVSDVLTGKYDSMGPRAQRRAEQIRALARELGYRPNAAARAVRTNRRRTIGVIVEGHPLALETMAGAAERLQENGFLAVVIPHGYQRELTLEDPALREQVTDGFIVVDGAPAKLVHALDELGPVIWVNSAVWRARGCLRRDEHAAGVAATRALVELGYERLHFVKGGGELHFSIKERERGFLEVMAAHELEHSVLEMPQRDDEELVLPRLLPGSALVTSSAYQAGRVLTACAQKRVRPGRDVGLISCDDAGVFNLTWPELARVTFDRHQMGRKAAELVLGALEKGKLPRSRSFQGKVALGPTAPPRR